MRNATQLWLGLLIVGTSAAGALVTTQAGSSGPEGKIKPFAGRELAPLLSAVSSLAAAERTESREALAALGVEEGAALLEVESGRWAMLRPSLALIPGNGRGNALTWEQLGRDRPLDDVALGRVAWSRLTTYLELHRPELRIETGELEPTVGVFEEKALVQISAKRRVSGLPVRGSRFTAVINHGNLILLGTRYWADIVVPLLPTFAAKAAESAVAAYLRPLEVAGWRESGHLEILPVLVSAEGYRHHLVWVLEPEITGSGGRWEALVDAHSGEVLAFEDRNHYGVARNINGGVYPASSDGVEPDGTMVDGYPMPYTDLDIGGFTDSGGNFEAAGSVTTTLDGQFVSIVEGCGVISETSGADIELEGTHGDTDCDVPPGHSPGDTAGARTAFYEINRIREEAASILSANAWLAAQLTANVNIDVTCGAHWNGVSLNFYRNSGGPCANTAQLAGVIDHEWGHGLDDNDVDGSIISVAQGGGEAVADLYAALRGDTSCIGRGFFIAGTTCGGYGDPCTVESGCTGVRTVDYADRQSGLPHTLTWVRANCINDGGGHCRGAAYSEAVWDLMKRDLPAVYGMDPNTAMEVTRRLFLIGGGNASGLFDFSGPAPGDAGCAAGQAYLQFLATDDDDGDLGNGTPHMTAIAAAFDRLEIGCTPGGSIPGPVVQDSGCVPTPATAPAVTAIATDQGADLSWSAVPDAATYAIYRTDGERQCDLGKALVGSTAGLSFADSGLQNERPYYYVVIPKGAGGDTCFGPASPCIAVGSSAIFADGFESGDTSAWTEFPP